MANNFTIKILVLDDDPFTLKLIERMLGNLGYTAVATRDSGRVALELVDSPYAHPDLILLDLNMPVMDGVEFVRHLVEHRYTGSIILFSGEDEQVLRATENLVRAHKITVLGHLRKPVTPEGLAALISKWAPPSQDEPQEVKKIYDAKDLRAALANGELVNYYHPKVSTISGRMVGVEALVRWNHPKDGMVLPEQFIGVAESHDLIGELARVVLTDALAQAKVWQDTGLVQQISVNVSINNLASPDFADFVAQLAAKAGVPPQMVVLEVSENCLMQEDMRNMLESLTRLHLKRFRLSINGFGTGNSTLLQLRDIPFDEFKIDRHCVHRAWTDGRLREKYDTCLEMARKLNIEVVAEGVEDMDDWKCVRYWTGLHRTGCDLAQGYFIAKPMPAADLPGWNAAWQKLWPSELDKGIPESK